MFISTTIHVLVFYLEGGLEKPERDQKLGGKVCVKFVSVKGGP